MDWWRLCDSMGIDLVGIDDFPSFARDPYVSSALCLRSSASLGVMIAVTNPITRDLSVAASAAATLHEIGGNRFRFAIGSGGGALWSVGLKRARVETMRQYVIGMRHLLAGRDATYRGRTFRMHWDPPFGEARIPVLVACAGPKTLEMASAAADGLIISMGYAQENIDYVYEIIERSCAAAGRDPGDLEIWWNSSVHFAGTVEEAMENSIGQTANWLTASSLDGKQIPPNLVDKLVEFTHDRTDLNAVYRTEERGPQLVRRAKRLGVYDWLVSRAPGFFGPPGVIADRLSHFCARGMTNWIFYVGEQTDEPLAIARQLGENVLPAISR
jgi:5,10-methylenetetrahydromethanopterin reductase